MMYLHDRIYRHAEQKFQESGKTSFPSVRQVARALKVTQGAVQEAVEGDPSGDLMLTSYNCSPPEPLGEHSVETFEKEGVTS